MDDRSYLEAKMHYTRAMQALASLWAVVEREHKNPSHLSVVPDEVGSKRFRDLSLSTRAWNCLRNEFGENGVIADIVSYGEKELLRIPNAGRRSVMEIKRALQNHGVQLPYYSSREGT